MAGLTVAVAGLDFVSPVIIPAGPGGFGTELRERYDLTALGAFTAKTVTPHARIGNPPPRLVDTGFGLINSIGLQNPGIAAFLDTVYPTLLPFPTHLFLSIAGETVNGFEGMARTLAGVLRGSTSSSSISRVPTWKRRVVSSKPIHKPFVMW
jgi:dihydroorotate dehydrogenase (NAD+) catalytic subunit